MPILKNTILEYIKKRSVQKKLALGKFLGRKMSEYFFNLGRSPAQLGRSERVNDR